MPRYRVVVRERSRRVYLIEAPDVDRAAATVTDQIRRGQRARLTRDQSDPRGGFDEIETTTEEY